jgi:hypothetical protein
VPAAEGATDRGIPQQSEAAEDMPRKPLRPGEPVRMIAIRKAARTPLTRSGAARASAALWGLGDNFGGASRRRPSVGRMDNDGFCAPASSCERCGGDYELVTMRTVRAPAVVEVCPRCDLGVVDITARRRRQEESAESFSVD